MSQPASGSDASSTSEKQHCTTDADAPFQTTPSQAPADLIDLLPPIIRHDETDFTGIRVPGEADIPLVLRQELDIRRIKAISGFSHFAASPTSSLHWQRAIGREILPMERLDMHLVYWKKKISIKPLPRLLLDRRLWQKHIRCDSLCRAATEGLSWPVYGPEPKYCLRATALGFLVSYTALITHESDFKIAKELQLVPEEITWIGWKRFAKELISHPDILEKMDRRFRLGELSLIRLSRAWRWTNYCYGPSYMPSYHCHTTFLEDWLGTLVTTTAFIVVILTGMQVGLATDLLGKSSSFQFASWSFCLFSIVAPPVAVAAVLFKFFLYSFFDLFEECMSENQRKDTGKEGEAPEDMV
jgi:hypothetical protein